MLRLLSVNSTPSTKIFPSVGMPVIVTDESASPSTSVKLKSSAAKLWSVSSEVATPAMSLVSSAVSVVSAPVATLGGSFTGVTLTVIVAAALEAAPSLTV